MNKKLVFDFLNDNLTSIQRKNLEQWLKDPANEEEFYSYLNDYENENMQYDVDVEEKLREVKERLSSTTPDKAGTLTSMKLSSRKRTVSFAAAATLLIMLGILWTKKRVNAEQVSGLAERLTSAVESTIEKVNNTRFPYTVVLPDNSSVILQPEGKISYSPEDFRTGKRVVYFEGTGFFEVSKNPDAPFIVNTNDFSTRVLGTSFTLRTARNSQENEIVVKTGKVAVFKADKGNGIAPGEPVLLSANQKLQFSKGSNLVPVMISKKDLDQPAEALTFEFDERPVSEVFQILSSAYHVEIDFEMEEMKNCKLTAFLSDEPLYEKIRLICFALDARYEINNKVIIITSNGC
ncbi:MAG: DUF4974 domain-containing protein [Leadbetterella sp.]|nr:DUF4974 domain-containing protein [Leadbetterella sp.]